MQEENKTLSFIFGYPVVVPTEKEDACDELPAFGMTFLEKLSQNKK